MLTLLLVLACATSEPAPPPGSASTTSEPPPATSAPTDTQVSSPTPIDTSTDTGPDPEEVPLATRPSAPACGPRPLPPEPVCDGLDWATCTSHADCTDGPSGTCIRAGGYSPGCYCAYDSCMSDADCPGGGVCACASEVGSQRVTNICLDADCRTDADCASGRCQAHHGFYCGAAGPDVRVPITGWYCATPQDTCDSHDDCDAAASERCIHLQDEGRFACSTAYIATCD